MIWKFECWQFEIAHFARDLQYAKPDSRRVVALKAIKYFVPHLKLQLTYLAFDSQDICFVGELNYLAANIFDTYLAFTLFDLRDTYLAFHSVETWLTWQILAVDLLSSPFAFGSWFTWLTEELISRRLRSFLFIQLMVINTFADLRNRSSLNFSLASFVTSFDLFVSPVGLDWRRASLILGCRAWRIWPVVTRMNSGMHEGTWMVHGQDFQIPVAMPLEGTKVESSRHHLAKHPKLLLSYNLIYTDEKALRGQWWTMSPANSTCSDSVPLPSSTFDSGDSPWRQRSMLWLRSCHENMWI